MYEMGEQLERVILAGVQTYESDRYRTIFI